MTKLSAIFIRSAPPGKHEDGNGLRLVKREDGGGQWVFRYTIHSRRREMGLGGLAALSLKDAREIASECRRFVAKGMDPIANRAEQRRQAMRKRNLLRDIALDAFESRKAELKGDGKAGRWFSPIELHILPKLGAMPVSEISQADVRDTLEPIWHSKASTAKKAADRLNIVLNHAAALGLDVDIQAVGKAKALLGRQRHLVRSIPHVPWQEVPEFYASLSEPTITHLALRLLILTGLRSKPIRFARLDEIEAGVWTIPAINMKGGVDAVCDFRVPLSGEARKVIEQTRLYERQGNLFPSVRKGVISDATMSRFMERRGMEARPHGFRTSIRTWLAECTDAPHEVAETMIAHVTDNRVVRTYRQTDYLDQRRGLLDRWADFVTGGTEYP
ncbi:tyrosine-type recombinase/integrase [Sulfitobacter mediterraneus]|uniref:tyrosine-type recombinase/integrase n=1 Tax=Sulfitobacter mediterraneus TaxID=83219 RepID=UPI0021A49D36|nr:integrase arm-type DNA-binding domain-containing protein [Sulfitobacter mediterraneus]UWR10931.1 integrase arm-type DNA-binding domain-containing protein [Sulfitobacter mediterraneus]